MTLTVISPPGETALPLAAAKAFLQIGHDGEDTLVADLLASATAQLETATGLALVSRILRQSWRCWPAGFGASGALLRPGPARTLTSVALIDEAGDETDISSLFALVDDRLCLKPSSWLPPIPLGGRVEVTFEAGFGLAVNIPADFIQALKAILASAYRRGSDDGIPDEARAIIASRRELRI
jgi:uncharacterized phiE125 gp8 family phage protein